MRTSKFTAAQDAYVDQTNPDQNFGANRHLRVDGDPVNRAFVAFDLSAVQGRAIRATLRLYALSGSSDGGGGRAVHALPYAGTWSETAITWNAVAAGDGLDGAGQFKVGSIDRDVVPDNWYEVDVTGAFEASHRSLGNTGLLTFMMETLLDDGVIYASRERQAGKYGPE